MFAGTKGQISVSPEEEAARQQELETLREALKDSQLSLQQKDEAHAELVAQLQTEMQENIAASTAETEAALLQVASWKEKYEQEVAVTVGKEQIIQSLQMQLANGGDGGDGGGGGGDDVGGETASSVVDAAVNEAGVVENKTDDDVAAATTVVKEKEPQPSWPTPDEYGKDAPVPQASPSGGGGGTRENMLLSKLKDAKAKIVQLQQQLKFQLRVQFGIASAKSPHSSFT